MTFDQIVIIVIGFAVLLAVVKMATEAYLRRHGIIKNEDDANSYEELDLDPDGMIQATTRIEIINNIIERVRLLNDRIAETFHSESSDRDSKSFNEDEIKASVFISNKYKLFVITLEKHNLTDSDMDVLLVQSDTLSEVEQLLEVFVSKQTIKNLPKIL